jgi:hypothetical protein
MDFKIKEFLKEERNIERVFNELADQTISEYTSGKLTQRKFYKELEDSKWLEVKVKKVKSPPIHNK